jgi:peptidyl-tRNA hydrolase, PTH2 family
LLYESFKCHINGDYKDGIKLFRLTKIILKVDSESKLQDLERDAFDVGINPAKVYDAGRTQLEPNTFTTIGIGPAPEEQIDQLIKDLKLL